METTQKSAIKWYYRIVAAAACSMLALCSPIRKNNTDVSGSELDEGRWKSVVHAIVNLDSLLCYYVETEPELELSKKTFEMFSERQREKIVLSMRYSGTKLNLLEPGMRENGDEHPKRYSFSIYDRYFDHLGSGDLAFEVTVTTSRFAGQTYLYLLKKNGESYQISYLLGTRGL